jgi:hypothetical protein
LISLEYLQQGSVGGLIRRPFHNAVQHSEGTASHVDLDCFVASPPGWRSGGHRRAGRMRWLAMHNAWKSEEEQRQQECAFHLFVLEGYPKIRAAPYYLSVQE